MDENEIVITVRSDNDTRSGFDSARKDAKTFSDDVKKIGISAGADAGKGLASGLVSTVSGLGGTLSGTLGPILGAVGLAAAPLIGATVAGAVIGGVGAGGIVGAFMVAKDDQRVVAALDAMGKRVQDNLKDAASPFVATTLNGLARIERAVDTIDIDQIFRDASRNAPALVEGVADVIEDIGDAVEDLSRNAGPVIDSIGQGLSDFGEVLGDGLSDLADNGEAGADAMTLLFGAINMTIEPTLALFNALAEVYEVLRDIGALGLVTELYLQYKENSRDAAAEQEKLAEASRNTADSFRDQTTALDRLTEELKKSTDPAYALLDAQDDLTAAQRDYNEAVDEHGKKSPEAEAALRKLAKEAQNVAGAAASASGSISGEMTPSMEKMLRKAGLSEDQIRDLKVQLQQAKKAADNWEGTFKQTYLVTRRENVNYAGNSVTGGRSHGGVVGAAANGGLRSGLTWVGENGPELAELPAGTTMHTAGDSQRMMRQAYAGGGSGPTEILLSAKPSSSRDLIALLIDSLQYECRTLYNGSAQEMLGQVGVAA